MLVHGALRKSNAIFYGVMKTFWLQAAEAVDLGTALADSAMVVLQVSASLLGADFYLCLVFYIAYCIYIARLRGRDNCRGDLCEKRPGAAPVLDTAGSSQL